MYVITRQAYWGVEENERYVVEIAQGGRDYANPDALVQEYSGEFGEFEDPREAVEVAISILKQWRKDGQKNAKIAVGYTGGMTLPFDPDTIPGAKKWAQKEYESLEKCPICSTIMEGSKEWYEAGTFFKSGDFLRYDDGYKYCSESCAEKASEFESEED